MESFAFGSPVLSTETDQVRVEVEEEPLSLAKAAAISSAAYAAALANELQEPGKQQELEQLLIEKIGVVNYSILKSHLPIPMELDPTGVYWPVTSKQFPEPGPAANMTYAFGDGGSIENDGLVSALQNGATHLAVFINTIMELPANVNWCGTINEIAFQKHLVDDNDPFYLFGFGTDTKGYHYGNNQVFPKSAMQPLFCELFTLQEAGKPMVAMQEVTLVSNTWWGIQGGNEVKILWNRLGVVRDFEKQLPFEVQEQLLHRNSINSNFTNYPYYPTMDFLTPSEINLLAAQTQYAVQENYAKFQQLLSRT